MRYARTIESMETSPKGILILYPSRLKNVLTLLLSLGFTAGGVWMIADREGSGWYVALFFGLCSAVFAAQLAPNASYLKLSPQGLQWSTLFRRWALIPWEEIGEFGVAWAGLKKMVVFDQRADRGPLVAMSRGLVGASRALPDTYGMKAEALAVLLNEWRTRH